MLNKLFKSILDQDRAPIVVCNTESVVVYMNPSAIKRYQKDLTGSSVKDCHSDTANHKIVRVLDWFSKSKDNNIVYTYFDEKENKDVYMIALRDDSGDLIGYYEKHEFKNRETVKPYNF